MPAPHPRLRDRPTVGALVGAVVVLALLMAALRSALAPFGGDARLLATVLGGISCPTFPLFLYALIRLARKPTPGLAGVRWALMVIVGFVLLGEALALAALVVDRSIRF